MTRSINMAYTTNSAENVTQNVTTTWWRASFLTSSVNTITTP